MKLSPSGIDTIELDKRYRQHKADLRHIIDSAYMPFEEKGFQIRQKKIQFHKSLRKKEHKYIMSIVYCELEGS